MNESQTSVHGSIHISNQIHPTVVIEGDVRIGRNNKILPYTILIGPLQIGDDNIIGPHVVIGSPGQDTRNPRYDSSGCRIEIGNGNIIREFTAIQKPCYQDLTKLGNGVHIMQSVHVPHDAIIEDDAVLTPMVAMGGIVRVLKGANLGVGASIHQYSVIGQYSIVAMGASLMKNLKPFSRFVPGKPLSVNTYAVDKFGYKELTDEISKYVLESAKPHTNRLLALTEHYERMHVESKRNQH